MKLRILKTMIVSSVLSQVLMTACVKDTTPPKNSHTDSTASTDSVNLKNGLLLYLPFEGNMADSSGNGNLTTAIGGATLTYDEHGNSASAFGGTGNGERIQVTNNGSIKFDTTFSLSFDLLARDARREAFVTMVNNTNGQGMAFGVGTIASGPFSMQVNVSDSLANCGTFTSNANALLDSTSFIPQAESWYNVIVIYHKGKLQTYINGSLFSTQTAVGTTVPVCAADKVIIGGWWDGDPATLNGKLDEVRLYNRVLNANEIAELSKGFRED